MKVNFFGKFPSEFAEALKSIRLVSCFEYVSRVMPVDELIITIYDAEFKCLKNVAIADAFGAHLSSEEIDAPSTP